jgi:hypothetical protein
MPNMKAWVPGVDKATDLIQVGMYAGVGGGLITCALGAALFFLTRSGFAFFIMVLLGPMFIVVGVISMIRGIIQKVARRLRSKK